MKTQLLQDIGESQAVPEAPGAAPALGRRLDPAPEPEQAHGPGLDHVAGFSFGFEAIDAPLGSSPLPGHWIDRWARRVVTACMLLIAIALAGTAGLWWYQESKVDSAMLVVARQAIAQRQAPPSPVPLAATTEPRQSAVEPGAGQNGAQPVEQRPVAPATQGAEPATTAKPAQMQAVTVHPDQAVEASKPPAATARPRGQLASGAAQTRDETLRQCRAAGYHEAQCIKRGCLMTRYGLACRG